MQQVKFNSEELSVLCDRNFMPLKASVTNKINELFGELKLAVKDKIESSTYEFPPELDIQSGKFSRGENYKSFAWRVFDFPRRPIKGDLMIYRALYLWGHHFSFHLILDGRQAKLFSEKLSANWKTLQDTGILFATRDTPWDWEISDQSHQLVDEKIGEQIPDFVSKHGFLKLSFAMKPEEYEKVPAVGAEIWGVLQKILFE